MLQKSQHCIIWLVLMIFTVIKSCPASYADVTVTGKTTGGSVWGSSPYTDDSDIGKAAVHFGLIQPCQRAIIHKTTAGQLTSYTASTANGVTTSSWGSWCGIILSLVSLQNSDPNCASFNPSTCACTGCGAGYIFKTVDGQQKCIRDPADLIRDCSTYATLSGGGYECSTCNPSPNIAKYQFVTNGLLANRCLNTLTEYLQNCGTYSFISSVYACTNCATGYQFINVTISGVKVQKCLNSATEVMSNCIDYGVNSTNNYKCTACASGHTLMLISGALRCLPNVQIDPNCVIYIYVAPDFQCSQCTALYTVANIYTTDGTFKSCLLITSLIRDCSVYESFSSGHQCKQCAALTNIVNHNDVFDSTQMKRCLNSVSEVVLNCIKYTIANPYVCAMCDSGFTLKPISGILRCLPNIVIDPECTTYILNGSNYECSVCNATFTVSNVQTSSGVYKYCLLTNDLIRNCFVYEKYSRGYQCKQCASIANLIIFDSVFDNVQMKRCLNSVTQVVPECSGYTIANPYVCSSCNSGFTLKPISGVPKCLPDIVIDPQCTTYIQNATSSAYECSVCNSTFTVSDVFTATGTYKYCISNDKLIRDCILYQRFSRGQACKQCSSSANIALHNFLYNGMQMNRCLNDLTEYDGNCTTYRFVNNIYYCISCVANYALKMNSGGPVSDICVECKTVTFKCKTCTTIWSCTSCQYPYILGPTGLCDKCQAGFQYVDTLCVKPVGCQSFLSDYSKCLACFGKYHFVYSPSKDVCVCDLHYKLATVDNKTVCVNQCGDGVITPPEEECDDQNTRNDDGCDQNCRVEKDFVCSSISPSSCKLQYKASTLKHNYVYKVEEKNRCRFSFSLFPVHPVFQYLDWEKYLHLNISASSEYVMPGSVSYSYEASTQEIFVQFDYEQSLEGMTVQAKFSAKNVPVSSSVKQVMTDAMEGNSMKTSNSQFFQVKTSSPNTVILQIISVPSELTAVFNIEGINAALQSQEMSMIKAYQVGCTVSLIISIFFLLQFFIGSYVHKMIGLETLQILQLLYFSRVIIEQKHTQFLHSMNYLKYAAYGGYSNYGLVYQTESPEPINLSYMTVNKKFLSAGLMKFYTLNVNLSLAFPILGLLYFAFTFIRKIYKRNQYLESRDQSEKDEYTILRRSSQSAYDHFVFPLINLFNFAAFFCTILYLQSKSSQNSSQRQFKTSEETEKIESTSFLPLICTLFISIFVFCLQIFNSYEDFMHSRLTQKEKLCIPKSLIQQLQHDQNNPGQPNYKPGYVLVYLFYYLLIQIVILTGVFAQQSQVSVSCETVAFLNLFYLIIIWRWKPYCINVNIHNKILRLNHFTSLIFLVISILMKKIDTNEMVWVYLFYLIFSLLVIVGICGFIRICFEYKFRNKLKDDISILQFDKERFVNKDKYKAEQNLAKLKVKLKQYEKNPFLFQNQILQHRIKHQLPHLKISQIDENQMSLIKKQMFDSICLKKKPKLTLENYVQKELKGNPTELNPRKMSQIQSKEFKNQDQKILWKETIKQTKQKLKKSQQNQKSLLNKMISKHHENESNSTENQ